MPDPASGEAAPEAAVYHPPPGARIIRAVDDPRADSDENLMLAYAAGDAGAFTRLYERHEKPVYRFLLRSLGAPAQAEELMQEVWVSVIRSASGYRPSARFTTWLYGIARSRLIDHWRSRRETVSYDEAAANDEDGGNAWIEAIPGAEADRPDVRLLSRAQAAAFMQAVQALPPPQREAFLLHVDAEMSLQEVAALTGVGTETAKSRVRYALAKLRLAMQAWQ